MNDTKNALSGGTAGIGVKLVEIYSKDASGPEVQISDLLPDGPAKMAGMLHAQDIITKVAGKSVKALSADEVHALLSGQAKSRVKVQVRRGQSKFETTIIREEPTKGGDSHPHKKKPPTTKKPHELTPYEQAHKVADGTGGRGVYKHSRRPDLGKATPEEAAKIREEDARVKAEAQTIADKEYEEEKRLREEELKKKNEEGMKQLWNLIWYGDERGPPPPSASKERWHKRTAKKVKQFYKQKKGETVVKVTDIYLEHKVNKMKKKLTGEDKKGNRWFGGEKKSQGWFGAQETTGGGGWFGSKEPKKQQAQQSWCAPCADSRK